jgi:hypothetical protein
LRKKNFWEYNREEETKKGHLGTLSQGEFDSNSTMENCLQSRNLKNFPDMSMILELAPYAHVVRVNFSNVVTMID